MCVFVSSATNKQKANETGQGIHGYQAMDANHDDDDDDDDFQIMIFYCCVVCLPAWPYTWYYFVGLCSFCSLKNLTIEITPMGPSCRNKHFALDTKKKEKTWKLVLGTGKQIKPKVKTKITARTHARMISI